MQCVLYTQYLYSQTNDQICILKPRQLLILAFPIFMVVWLFLFKLHQIIVNIHLTEKDDMLDIQIRLNRKDSIRSELDPIISAMSRLSISILISLIGQIGLYFTIWPFFPGIACCTIILCNTLSVIHCFKNYRKCYKLYCCPCDNLCKSSSYRVVYARKIIKHRNRPPTLS